MQPEIDFYIFDATNRLQVWQHACRLVEKYYNEAKTLHLHFDNLKDAELFDQLLWTFHDTSFIPHAIVKSASAMMAPVTLGMGDEAGTYDVLFNFGLKPPPSSKRCAKIIDFVFTDPSVQQEARQRYVAYRDAGHKINNYKLKAADL